METRSSRVLCTWCADADQAAFKHPTASTSRPAVGKYKKRLFAKV